MKEFQAWPAWRYGPNNQSGIFNDEAEVPAGWVDHPLKVADVQQGSNLAPAPAPNPGAGAGAGSHDGQGSGAGAQNGSTGADRGDVDADGWPYDPALHAATQTRTKANLWRMKVGVTRPAPKEGYPKPVIGEQAKPLDL